LKIAGAAIGGLIPDFPALLPAATQLEMPQAIPAINGLANSYPNFTQWLNENLKESKASKFWMASKQCSMSNVIFLGDELGNYFKRGLKSFLNDPIPASVLKHGTVMGQSGTPKIPWYLYQV
jgi:hypothetical protein